MATGTHSELEKFEVVTVEVTKEVVLEVMTLDVQVALAGVLIFRTRGTTNR